MNKQASVRSIILVLLPLITVVLEFLPYGVGLNFVVQEANEFITIEHLYSYFDFLPVGYANVGPFLAAILTVVLLILSVIFIFKGSAKLLKTIVVIASIAFLCSLMPMIFGISNFTALGAVITLLLLAEMLLACSYVRTSRNSTTKQMRS